MMHHKLLSITFLFGVFLSTVSMIYHTPLRADGLSIDPDSAILKGGGSVEFSVKEQTGPLYWTTVKGNLSVVRKMFRAASFLPDVVMGTGQLQILEGAKVHYTAPFNSGTYSVAVTDGTAIAVAEIQVRDLAEAIIRIEIVGKKDRTLTVDATQALSLQAWLADLTQQDYSERALWESSDPAIVEVSDVGLLTAYAPGRATISAHLWGQTDQIQVTVQAKQAVGLVITPSPVYLTTDGVQTLEITKILQGSDEKQLAESGECHLNADNENAVTVTDNAELTPISPGHAMIKVECGDLTASVPVFVSSPFPLEATPNTFTLGRNDSKSFTIIGGMPPYIPTATKGRINGHGERWHYHAERTAGDDTIMITDQAGTETSINVTVTKGLVLSPLTVDLSANTQKEFTASGGVAPYRWRVSAGFVNTTEGSQVIYTAPEVQGVYEITVVDKQGQVETAVINIGSGLIATPNQLIMNPEEERRFQITGGTPPYTVSTTAGKVPKKDDNDDSYYYVAPEVSGDYSIMVKDIEGRNAMIAIIVESTLQVTPKELFLRRNESAELIISGGYGDYCITTKTGESEDEDYCTPNQDGKFAYQAANVAGQDVITITDQAGTVVQVEVLVSREGFYASPGESYVLPGEKVKLRALGGTAPYGWKILGAGDLSANEGEHVTFTAPDVAGNYSILVTDNTGQEAKSLVVVYQGELQLIPELLVLAPDESANLHALLGVPDYTWWTERGQLSTTKGEKVTYTAPTDSPEDIIWLEDASGKIKTLRAVISTETIHDISDLYAGDDGKLDNSEVDRAITDHFQKEGWITRTELFLLIERFLAGN